MATRHVDSSQLAMPGSPFQIPHPLPTPRQMQNPRVLTVAILLGFGGLVVLSLIQGRAATWRLWQIAASDPVFMDARVITAGAVAHRAGLDPLVENPADSEQRPLNYPRIWQGLYALGVDEHDGFVIGLVAVGGFLAGLLLFVNRLPNPPGWWLLVGVFSPVVMLGIDRGNIDLPLFGLLAAAIVAARRAPAVATACIWLAFVLKLYPLAGIVALLERRRDAAFRLLGLTAAFVVLYLVYSYGDLGLISRATPRGTWLSYGRNVLWMELEFHHPLFSLPLRRISWLMLLAMGAWAGIGAVRRARSPSAPLLPEAPAVERDAFRVGAACFTGTFLLGNNFDYRLVFLLFAVPLLVRWSRANGAPLTRVARVGLGMVTALWWWPYLELLQPASESLRLLTMVCGELISWTAFATLLRLLAESLPDWRTMVPKEVSTS